MQTLQKKTREYTTQSRQKNKLPAKEAGADFARDGGVLRARAVTGTTQL